MATLNCSNGSGYRAERDHYVDEGREVLEITVPPFSPNFYNRNTIQIWDVSNYSTVDIIKWQGTTLKDRSLHEITLVNNSGENREIKFLTSYTLPDEDTVGIDNATTITIGPNGSAHFYCSAVFVDGNLELSLRTGSQDDRKIVGA